jgi:glycosyltransferase involved in cell wall biosynthesis
MEAVTVVIPTRNRPDLLSLTLTSVLRQRDVDLRVVVVDDASTNDVASVVQGCDDSRVRVVRQVVRKGVSAARNRGAAEATTDWVAFCDDDDLWSPEKLHRQLVSARGGGDWAYAGCVFVDAQLEIHGGTPPLPPDAMVAALRSYNAVPAGASNVLIRTDVFRDVGGFDESLTHVPDWDLWLRLAEYGVAACVNSPLVAYRMHAANASLRTAEMLAELTLLEQRHGLTRTRAFFLRHLAHLCLRSNRLREAVIYLLRALLSLRDGYTRNDFEMDWRLFSEHAAEILRRRLRRPPSKRAMERLQIARARDPHAAWKAAAAEWLDEFRRCEEVRGKGVR